MTVSAAPAAVRTLDDLPHASLRDVVQGFGLYARPGTHRSRLHRLGERFVVDLPAFPTLLVTSKPEDAKAVLGAGDGSLSFGQVLSRFMPHDVLFGEDAFIFMEGEEHLRERRKIGAPFHGAALKAYEGRMEDVARHALRSWTLDRPAPFIKLGYRLSMDVMMSVIFGVRGERSARLEAAMRAYCNVVHQPAFLGLSFLAAFTGGHQLPYPPLQRGADAADALILAEMAERRRHPEAEHSDVMAAFLEMNEDEENPKTDAEIARGLRGLVLAGFETTAVTLSWVGEYLAHHPAVLAECHRAIDAGDDGYLDAVIAEVMRIRPSVPMTGRRAMRDVEVNGIRVPAGAFVLLATMRVHERPDVYDEPLAFKPERFVGKRPGTYTWLTFGGGPHRCMGGAFALFEARVLLRTLLREHTIAPEAGPVAPCKTTHAMLVPEDGARITMTRRSARGASA
jgi:hypothetical protein